MHEVHFPAVVEVDPSTSISDYLVRHGTENPTATLFRQKVGDAWVDWPASKALGVVRAIAEADNHSAEFGIVIRSDMKGLKLRVPKNKVMISTFKAFGAEPVPLAWSETPTALQTRTIDGGDNGTSVIKDMKFYEFTKHLVILDHFAGVAPLFASDRMMRKLKPDQVAAIRRAADEAVR